jgi:hypothetical protein
MNGRLPDETAAPQPFFQLHADATIVSRGGSMQMSVMHAARWDGVIVLIVVVLWTVAEARCQDLKAPHTSNMQSTQLVLGK